MSQHTSDRASGTDRSTDDRNESNGQTESSTSMSRRRVLGGAAGAAVLAGGPFALSSASARTQQDRSDVDILNFALTLEHLENEFYIQQLDKFDERDFQRSDLLDEFGFGMRFTARDYLRVIQEHEQAHVDFLTTALEDAGANPAEAASEYNFAAPLGKEEIETVGEFAAVAQALEATGVDAYAGAAPEISNASFIPPALSIHSVEANHAAYVRNLNGELPMPEGFNEAKSIDTVLGIVDPIIVEQ